MYEWLPWVDGELESVPKDKTARLAWLKKTRGDPPTAVVRQALGKWYGARAESLRSAEAFELCEYGRQATEAELRTLFPFFD